MDNLMSLRNTLALIEGEKKKLRTASPVEQVAWNEISQELQTPWKK
jgi:hypothetical protein